MHERLRYSARLGVGRSALAVVAVLVLVVFALAGSAQAAKSKPAGVTFVLLSGRHAGERVKTDGGPNVPARLNGGRISGRLIPQSEGNEFTFKGTVRGRGRARSRAAKNIDAAALPRDWVEPPLGSLSDAIGLEETASSGFRGFFALGLSTQGVQLAIPDLSDAIKELDGLRAAGKITAEQHLDFVAKLNSAKDFDKAAVRGIRDALRKPTGSEQQNALKKAAKAAVADLGKGIAEKQQVLTTISELGKLADIFAVEPPPTPVAEPPVAVAGPLFAINGNSTLAAGTQDPGTAGSKGLVVDTAGNDIVGPAGTNFTAFGPNGAVGGEFQGNPAFVPSPFFSGEQPTPLPTGTGGTGGEVRGGDSQWFVGFVFLRGGFERAAAWLRRTLRSRARASRLAFTGYRVRGFAGGSSLFTVSGDLAFGDHFDRGTSGPFRAFRIDLRTGVLAELFRPRGGSSQPKGSNATGLAAGGAVFSNGAVQVTYWWGGQHYLRFPTSPGIDTDVYGMNAAGVAVGLIGLPGNFHAALFEHGNVYDLNSLIPSGSGWTLTKASAISNTGVVVGAGILNGQQRGFVLNLSSPRH